MAYAVKWIDSNGKHHKMSVQYHELAVEMLQWLIVQCGIYSGQIVKVKG